VVAEVTNLLGVDAKESGIFRRAKNAVKNAAKKAGKKAKKFVSKTMGKVMNTLLKKKKAAAKKLHKKAGLTKKLMKDLKKHVSGKKKQVSPKKAAGVAVARLEGGLDRRMDKKYDVHSIARKKVTMPVSAKYENGKIKPPGYVASDAVIGAGHKYLLGPSRRRIGAGFGRRRAPVKIPHRVKKAVHKDLKKHLITRVAQKPHRKVIHHVVAKKHIPKKVKRKMMSFGFAAWHHWLTGVVLCITVQVFCGRPHTTPQRQSRRRRWSD